MCPLSSLPDSKQQCLANSSLSGLGACHKSRPLPQVQRRIVGWKPEAEQRLMKCIKLLSWLTHHRFCPPSASPSKRTWDWSFLTQSYIKCELWVLPCPTTPLTLSPLVPPPKGLKLPHPILQKVWEDFEQLWVLSPSISSPPSLSYNITHKGWEDFDPSWFLSLSVELEGEGLLLEICLVVGNHVPGKGMLLRLR